MIRTGRRLGAYRFFHAFERNSNRSRNHNNARLCCRSKRNLRRRLLRCLDRIIFLSSPITGLRDRRSSRCTPHPLPRLPGARVAFYVAHVGASSRRSSPATRMHSPHDLHPTLDAAIAYNILMTSLARLYLGVLWMRTRNFRVVVLVHGAMDLLPNLVPRAKGFHLAR